MTASLTVVKLGGALLTDKTQPYTLRDGILSQVAGELQSCRQQGLFERLVLVHGVGSFGHPPVVAHGLHKGFQSPEQLIHLTGAQNSVLRLRLALAEACHGAGLPVATILPSSCMTARNFRTREMFLDPVAGFLDLGMIPLLGGDVLVDDGVGFSVGGGDALAVALATHFGARRLVFATAVAGIYDRDPASHPDARLLPQVSLGAATNARLDRRRATDASGAMAGKLDALRQARNAMAAGLRVDILSMLRPGALTALLTGEVVGTRIVP